MRRCSFQSLSLLLLSLLFVSTTALAGLSRVEGHKVYYSAERAYTVDPEYVYIGSYSEIETTASMERATKLSSRTYINEVFGLKYNGTNELVELFIAQWHQVPNSWRVGEPGPIPTKYYDFKPARFKGLSDFLTSKGYTFSTDFYGGMMMGYGENITYTKYYFAIANTVLPKGVDKKEHLQSVFAKKIVPAQ